MPSREESKKISKKGSSYLPQLNLDPEKRRDLFNKLLEKYSTRSTKIPNPTSRTVGQCQPSYKIFIPTPKSAPKSKEKITQKKKNDKNVKAIIGDEIAEAHQNEMWKNKVRNHTYDKNAFKENKRVKNRFPFPLPRIDEQIEPVDSSDDSSTEGSKEKRRNQDSNDHSFTFYHSGDQGQREEIILRYKEKPNSNSLPHELKPRHLTKTFSGSMIWAGNDIIHSLLKSQKCSKPRFGGDEPSETEIKTSRGSSQDDSKSNGYEERQCKTLVKVKKSKSKKTTAVLELDDGLKSHKQNSSAESKQVCLKPSSSSLPHIGLEENSKSNKKSNEKCKKPKKLIKKQTFTLVTTSKPSA